jgi:PAS domain S-box-containing protein
MAKKEGDKSKATRLDSDEKYRTITENINVGIYRSTAGPEGKYIEVNPAMYKMFGYSSKSEYLKIHPVDIYQLPEDRDKFSHKVLNQGLVRNEILNCKKKDGTPIICSTTAMAVRNHHGQVEYIDGIVEDITDRIKTEQALKEAHIQLENRVRERTSELQTANLELRQSEAKYRSLFENMIEGLFLTRPDGIILAANPALVKMLGYDSEAELCKTTNVQDLYVKPEYRKFLTRKLEREGEVRNFELQLRCKSGRKITVLENARIVRDEQGDISHYEGLLTDITEIKKADAERQKLQSQMQYTQKLKSLEILAGGIAHDFNNLLMAILGNASLASSYLSPDALPYQFIKKIEKSSKDAAELTNQMLAYSGKGKFILKEVNISGLIDDMRQLLKASVSKKVSLKFEFGKLLPSIMADSSQIRQVILSLIINSSEAIGEKSGTVQVKTDRLKMNRASFADDYLDPNLREGEYIYLEVTDSGPGMEANIKNRIFDPFFTTKFSGRGLGLAVVLGIVRGHNGTLKVWSKPGKGSSIRVLFPIMEKKNKMKTREKSNHDEEKRDAKTILVVDDEEAVLDVTSNMLESAGFKVLKATDGREGVDVFSRHKERITLVLLDTTMPNMNGEEAFQELTRIEPKIKVILSSGYSEQEATSHFIGQGLAGFIQKPYSLNQLIDKINEVLEVPD